MEQMSSGRLSEAIAFQIAELILSGQIESGTKLRQEELARCWKFQGYRCVRLCQTFGNTGTCKKTGDKAYCDDSRSG